MLGRKFCPHHASIVEAYLANPDAGLPKDDSGTGAPYTLREWLGRQLMDPEERRQLELSEAAGATSDAEQSHLRITARRLGGGSAGKALAKRLVFLSKIEDSTTDKLIVQAVREMLDRKGLRTRLPTDSAGILNGA